MAPKTQTVKPEFKLPSINSTALKAALIVIAFVVVGFLTYANTFESPFVFDDNLRILDNPDIRMEELSLKSLRDAAFGKYSARSRPVGNISFALNYYFHQFEPAGYHLVNIIVHIATGILLWLFLKMTLGIIAAGAEDQRGEWIALAAALLWLVNPVQTQSVTYIVQRLNSMAAMFFLLSFICYLKGRLTADRRWIWAWFLGAALAWLLALGCKQNTATLPFFIILYEWYFFQNLNADWLKRNLKYVAIVLAVFVIVGLVFLGSKPLDRLTSMSDFADKEFTVVERALTQFRVVIYYISLILFPHPSRQNLDYDFPLSYSLLNPATTLLAMIGLIGLTALAVVLARRQRLISFGIFWYLGNLVIESSIIPLAIIFEHRLYLPSMLVWLIPLILIQRYSSSRGLIVGLSCALPVVALFSYWTYERNNVWRDAVTLWQDCVKKSPQKGRTYANLGAAQKRNDQIDEAKQNLRRSLALNPDLEESHYNLGVIFDQEGQRDVAIDHYRKAIELNPEMVPPRNNLGAALLAQGNTDEAVEHFQKALQYDPDFAETYNNLGLARSKQGKVDEAIEHYNKALQLNPESANAYFNLGVALVGQGKNDEGVGHIRRALAIDPDHAGAHNNLGGHLLAQGKVDEAFVHFKQALAADPGLAEAHNNMGIVMIRRGKLDGAISRFQDAVRLDPDFTRARYNLEQALAIKNGRNPAIAAIQKKLVSRPDDPVLHFELGNLYLGQGQLPLAVIEFEKALRLQPDFLAARNNLAMALAADRQYDRALKSFEKLIELDPDNAGSYYNIAVLHALRNRVDESIAWLKKALDRGYRNWNLIKTDPDLTNIRKSEEYRQLVEGH